MPQITLTRDEATRLSELLREVHSVCTGENDPAPVNWEFLDKRIQRLRMDLFQEA